MTPEGKARPEIDAAHGGGPQNSQQQSAQSSDAIQGSEGNGTPVVPRISLIYDQAINFAFQQNAIPVIKELRFRNDDSIRKNLIIRITTDPPFAEPVELRLQGIDGGGEFHVAPLDLKLSPEFLSSLNERVSGWLKCEVVDGDSVICSRTDPISLLARNEWCRLVALPEILAAFILPNDTAVMTILNRGAELLREHTGRSAFNGYQDKSHKRAWEQVAAIYKAVAELGIRYIVAPASFENTGQKVRSPADILAQRFANCLDLSLLFCACFEQVGLHPLVLMHEGHVYPGSWLEERTLPEPSSEDLQHIRKLVTDEVMTVFESTTVTNENSGTLRDAELLAQPHLRGEKPFRLALDTRRSRMARIHPLPIPNQPLASTGIIGASDGPVPAAGIGEREFAEPIDMKSGAPVRPATRIDQWKSRLLDLSLRNRLLNFRETKTTIRILSAEPERVEDELAAERELSLRPRPKVMSESDPRNEIAYTQQQHTDALTEHLIDELKHGRLHTHLEDTEHVRRLTELYRSARNAIEENGTNTLFAAVGFLEWRETEYSDRTLRAPLLLVPVELKRKSVLEGFSLRRIDEETRLNVTLMEMLRQQFQKEIAGLDPLPEDESGVDVALVFRIFREAVRDLPGWEVKTEVWLGQFSFTKFLLWKDLADRLDDLTRNRVVNHLVNEAGTPYPNPADDIRPEQLDNEFHPRDIFCPRSADSSQLAAVMAAAAGHDFVLEGPPGTGKSQTIANIIAHCLANKKRVLFVAEKRAALDVVYRRLREEGLEPFCLELHSNKTGKSDVVAQFDRSLRFISDSTATDWEHRATELERLQDALNGYTRALHRRHPCGLSAHHCLDYLLPRQQEPTVRLDSWSSILTTPRETLERAREVAGLLQQRSRPLMPLVGHPLTLLACEDWSPAWADRMPDRMRELGKLIESAMAALNDIRTWLQWPGSTASRAEMMNLVAFVDSLLAAFPVGEQFALATWLDWVADLDHWTSLVRERIELRKPLVGYDEPKLLALDLDLLNQKWKAAQNAWFLPKWMRLSFVRRHLRTARPDQVRPDINQLSDVLKAATRLRVVNADLDAATPKAELLLGSVWSRGEPQLENLVQVREWGAALHEQMAALVGGDSDWMLRVRELVGGLFRQGPASHEAGTAVGARLTRFRETQSEFNAAFDAFVGEVRLRRERLDAGADYFPDLQRLLGQILSAWSQIREWCFWQKVRSEAVGLAMLPVITQLESEGGEKMDAAGLFERSFRRDLFFAAVESEPSLRDFFGQEHNERIDRFREVDGRKAGLAREIIRARLAAGIPRDQGHDDVPKLEIGLLRREIAKKTRHIPVRQLLNRIPNLLPRLKPCVLMSPLSVAQYLEPSHAAFDVVIFDEASQIPVWDAIGAIARGQQLIVVGDPKQLPPTNFFNSAGDDDDNLAPEEFKDLESILDELMSHELRRKRLQWHYRSRHEGLITFSNRQYYENELLTFPSSETALGGVKFRHLPDARYDKGKSRTNRSEADALVSELIRRLRDNNSPRRSFGVVTFSLAQQQLVENLLDEERRKYPEIEIHFGDEPPLEGEPVFVKNLENVQGDERDVIFFSVCYGADESGRVAMNFGPLNRDGGERRLNVAITRAKHEIVVFSGLRADQIDLTRTRARGVRDLKYFLDYAERGPGALAAMSLAADAGEAESEFERMVADRLRAAGFEVHNQVGCSGYRIDLGILDPANPGKYRLGVECDGATYHRAATARDRDKLRQAVLEGLGWTLYRIWSTDWWHDSEKEMQKLLSFIDEQEESA